MGKEFFITWTQAVTCTLQYGVQFNTWRAKPFNKLNAKIIRKRAYQMKQETSHSRKA